MAKDSPTHPYAIGDGNNPNNAQPFRTRDETRDLTGVSTFKSKGLERKLSSQSLNIQESTYVKGYAQRGLQDLTKE
ncbi:hypothetical protein EC991_006769, partial [Linnemannia zychae]